MVAHGVAEGKQQDHRIGKDLARRDGFSTSHGRSSVPQMIFAGWF
jgi:hypothetical protein